MLHKHDDGVEHDDGGFFTLNGQVVAHRHLSDTEWVTVSKCENCDEEHEPDKCCDCGAPAIGYGRFGQLCSDHGYEAEQDRKGDMG